MNNLRKIAFVFAIVLCLNHVIQASTCPTFDGNDLLQSGKKQFVKSAMAGGQYIYQAPISYRLPNWGFQFAATTSTIGGYNSFGGFNFQVDGRRKGNSNSIQLVLIIGPDQAWTSAQISYFVSSRDDFVLWNGKYAASQWFKKPQNGVYDIVANINKQLPQFNYRVAAFISGFSSTDRQLKININEKLYQSASKRLTITIFCSTNPLPISVGISYVIYPSNHPILQVSYGLPQGDTGAYQISGPTSLSNTIEYNQFRIQSRFLTCTGNQCQKACILKERCIQLNGNVYQGQCIFCAPGIIFQFGCTRRCGANQDYINRVCICRRGFTRSGKDCVLRGSEGPVPCKSNQIRWNGICRPCPFGSFPDTALTTCLCQNNFQYIGQQNSCNPTCNLPKVFVGGSCVCPPGTISYGDNCLSCPPGSFPSGNTCLCPQNQLYDPVRNSCYTNCGPSQEWKGSRCECISGYHQWLGACQACPKSSVPTFDGKSCQCYSKTAVYVPKNRACIQCGSNAFPDSTKTSCQCSAGYRPVDSVCVPIKTCEFNEDLINGNCQCKFGWRRLGPICVQVCGKNQYYDGKICICSQGHARINNVCRPCPQNSLASVDKLTCLCKEPNKVYIPSVDFCQFCPANSYPASNGLQCVCNKGYQLQGSSCVSRCPVQSIPDSDGICTCLNGKNLVGGVCVTPVICPPKSSFNRVTSSCACLNPSENIIDGVCQRCQQNSVWSKNQCVCQTGFFRISSQCRICDARSKYNGTDCVCNLGYYGNRDQCKPCHSSCSQCTGPNADQCLACADITLVLQKGYCSKNAGCNFGYYLDGKQCTKCIDNCIDCDSSFVCRTCAIGYTPKKAQIGDQEAVFCEQICGDGIKYQQQCDDGNQRDGDGCNSNCQEQKGWYCSGGSSNKPSFCVNAKPDQTVITSKGAVNLGTEVLLSVRASYLPDCITKNTCLNCFKAITVNVVNANVPILVTINYIPLSQYQFVIKFDFQNVVVTSIFKAVIRLNRQFQGCFYPQDFNDQIQITVDPAFLAKIDPDNQLTLEDIKVKPTSRGGPGERVINVPPTAFRNLGI